MNYYVYFNLFGKTYKKLIENVNSENEAYEKFSMLLRESLKITKAEEIKPENDKNPNVIETIFEMLKK